MRFACSHRGPEMWWSQNATIEDWFDEMVGQANILNRFANVRMSDIRGIRVPFLRVGWNRQFLMMKEFGFVYDSSMVAPLSNRPLWPYTLDYQMPHSCTGVNQNCPSRSYAGIWEMVINQLEVGEYSCGMIDTCPPHLSGDDIYRMLTHNFKRHYLSNRAPYGLYFHAAWFKKVDYLNAFLVGIANFYASTFFYKYQTFCRNSSRTCKSCPMSILSPNNRPLNGCVSRRPPINCIS